MLADQEEELSFPSLSIRAPLPAFSGSVLFRNVLV